MKGRKTAKIRKSDCRKDECVRQVAYACGSGNIMRCKIEGRADASGLTQTKYCNRAPDVQHWQIREEGRD